MHQHKPGCEHHKDGAQKQGCSHSQSQSHGHGHGHGPQQKMSSSDYFKNLKESYYERPEFFWSQIIRGEASARVYEKLGLKFINSLNCNFLFGVLSSLQHSLTCDWIPLVFRPFTSGFFLPFCFLLFFNYNVIVGIKSQNDSNSFLIYFILAPIILYVLVALRGSGSINTAKNRAESIKAKKVRPYLESPAVNCLRCKVLKAFRSFHCPRCDICVPKFNRHSFLFSICIGAANELLAFLFFSSVFISQLVTTAMFLSVSQYGFLTNLIFYLLNLSICWSAFCEASNYFMLNFYYGISEYELSMWSMCQYLMKVPQRQFSNEVDNGLCHNLTESIYALLGISGAESNPPKQKPRDEEATFEFEPLGKKKHIMNWNKALVYLIPQMLNHKRRDIVIDIMKKEEPRMIETFKMQMKFKEEVLEENKGADLHDMQIQQLVMVKMQAHFMKNPQKMPGPTTEQQKIIQLQMLGHIKKEIETQPDLLAKVSDLEQKLKDDLLTPIEVNLAMREIQQKLMAAKMQKMAEQKKRMEEQAKIKQVEDEEENLTQHLSQQQL